MGLIHLLSITGSKTLAATLLLVFVWPLLVASFALAQVTTTITPTTGDRQSWNHSDGRWQHRPDYWRNQARQRNEPLPQFRPIQRGAP